MQRQIVNCDFIKSFIRIHQWDWIRKRSLCRCAPHLSSLLHPPLYVPSSPSSLVYPSLSLPLPASTLWSMGDLLSPTIFPSCSLTLSLLLLDPARNKFATKMGKNDHHGPARGTQGESDIIHPPPALDPPPPSPHRHQAWRQWDACATNHLYTLISASGPRCCLLLSEQMTFRKRSELGGRDEEMGRWGKRSRGRVVGAVGRGVWQFAGMRGRLWELDLKLRGKLCAPYVKFCKGDFHCAPILCVCVEWNMCVCVFCFKMKHLGCLLNHLRHCLNSLLLSPKELLPHLTTRKWEMWRTYCL